MNLISLLSVLLAVKTSTPDASSVYLFRDSFSEYARKSLDRLTRNIVSTSNALKSKKWLNGANFIYNIVQNKRSQQGLSTKPLEEWLGIQQEVESLAMGQYFPLSDLYLMYGFFVLLKLIPWCMNFFSDLSLKDFPMPNLTEFLKLDIPQTNNKQSSIPRISEITLPRNQWYFHYQKPAGPTPMPSAAKGQQAKFKGSDIISWSALICILVIIDLVWFVHRMARSYATAKMILYGCPSFIDCKKPSGE